MELQRLLAAYDRENRLAIDAVYAQFSPTLDDFYLEELRLVFAPEPDAQGMLPVEVVLTRTVPGLEPRTVRGAGAAFPLRRAAACFAGALRELPGGRGEPLLARLRDGQAWLVARQVGQTQAVALVLEPEGRDALALLPPHPSTPSPGGEGESFPRRRSPRPPEGERGSDLS
ncbi:MAG TPA: hypothetical protein VHS99_09445 [Chloroflexota bacterium]|nr:hypothetical protein [Chloroflexota bacterium]